MHVDFLRIKSLRADRDRLYIEQTDGTQLFPLVFGRGANELKRFRTTCHRKGYLESRSASTSDDVIDMVTVSGKLQLSRIVTWDVEVEGWGNGTWTVHVTTCVPFPGADLCSPALFWAACGGILFLATDYAVDQPDECGTQPAHGSQPRHVPVCLGIRVQVTRQNDRQASWVSTKASHQPLASTIL